MPIVIDRDRVRQLVDQEAAQLVEVLPRASTTRSTWLARSACRSSS